MSNRTSKRHGVSERELSLTLEASAKCLTLQVRRYAGQPAGQFPGAIHDGSATPADFAGDGEPATRSRLEGGELVIGHTPRSAQEEV